MTREIKLSLLMGLAFIVLFGVFISTGSKNNRAVLLTSLSTPASSRLVALRDTVIIGDQLSQLNPKKKTIGDKVKEGQDGKASSALDGVKPSSANLPQDDSLPKPENTAPTKDQAVSPHPNTGESQYTVQAGDSWYKIARSQWGARYAGQWKLIYEANKNMLKKEKALVPGMVLVIPPRP